MADIMTMIEDYEDSILEAIATFIDRVLGLPIYIKDKPFIAPKTPYVTVRIISATDSGGWGQRYMFAENMYSYVMDNTYQVEIMIYRGRPMPAMNYLLSAFRGFSELKYEKLYLKGVSFLSASGITEANTVLDGDKTQLRSRCIFTFNTRLISEDIETGEISQVSYTIRSFRDDYTDKTPVVLKNLIHLPSPDTLEASGESYDFINNDGLPETTYATWYNEWTT